MGRLLAWCVLAYPTLAENPLRFVHPSGEVFAGSVFVQLVSDVSDEDIVGLELLINGETATYFDQPPYETKIDLRDFPDGPILFSAVLTLFSGEEWTRELKGRNISHFYSEDVVYVRVPVLARSRLPQGVGRLAATDFRLREEGLLQNMTLLLAEQQPIDVVVLIDTSGSMESNLGIVKRSLSRFFDLLKPTDRVQMIGFNHTVYPICDLESNKEMLKYRTRSLLATGETNLYAAIWSGIRAAGQVQGRRAVLLFTDGRQELTKRYNDLMTKSLSECLQLGQQEGVPIYAIGVGDEIEPGILHQLSVTTGGQAFILEKRKAIEEAFLSIGKQLGYQYLLCYYSNSRKKGPHHIKIEVPDVPELDLRYPEYLYFK